MSGTVNQILSLPGTMTNYIVKNAVVNQAKNLIASTLFSGFTASVRGISKTVDFVVIKPAAVVASAVAKAAVTADPYLTGVAGIAGAGLAFKGAYDFINSDDDKLKAKAELAAGLTGVGYATVRVVLPFLKKEAVNVIQNNIFSFSQITFVFTTGILSASAAVCACMLRKIPLSIG